MMTMTEQERAQEGRARRWKLMAALSALVIGVAMAAVGLRFAWLDREAGLPERGDG